MLIQLFTQLRALLHKQLAPYTETTLAPFVREVLALDVSSLDQVARSLPSLRTEAAGSRTLLPGKLAALFDLRCQQWRRLKHIENPQENEKVFAQKIRVASTLDVSMPLLIRYLPALAAGSTDPIALFVQRGRFACLIHPSSRLQTVAPIMPFHLLAR